jgi:3-methyladenine DNA glycosylase/8-oxoguanine DNA glycosylase
VSTTNVILTPRGPFSLAASIRFLNGFTPLATEGKPDAADERLRLAFTVEADWRPVAVSVHETESGRVGATITGEADPDRARGQLERILSLDVDASDFEETVRRDAVAAGLVDEFPSLRPVCFSSPYEAAAWTILSQRVQMRQAAKVRQRICERLGDAVDVDGHVMHAFPSPETLRAARSIEGVPAAKLPRLHAVAEAALDGRLDADALRSAGPENAIAAVQDIHGIGPFGAELVVIRGAGEPDYFSRTERRLHRAMADAYGVENADVDALQAIADAWRPFRSWVGFLFRTRAALAPS